MAHETIKTNKILNEFETCYLGSYGNWGFSNKWESEANESLILMNFNKKP